MYSNTFVAEHHTHTLIINRRKLNAGSYKQINTAITNTIWKRRAHFTSKRQENTIIKPTEFTYTLASYCLIQGK